MSTISYLKESRINFVLKEKIAIFLVKSMAEADFFCYGLSIDKVFKMRDNVSSCDDFFFS